MHDAILLQKTINNNRIEEFFSHPWRNLISKIITFSQTFLVIYNQKRKKKKKKITFHRIHERLTNIEWCTRKFVSRIPFLFETVPWLIDSFFPASDRVSLCRKKVRKKKVEKKKEEEEILSGFIRMSEQSWRWWDPSHFPLTSAIKLCTWGRVICK